MAGGSDVAEAASLSCVQCSKPAHLQYVILTSTFFFFFFLMVDFQPETILSFKCYKVYFIFYVLGYMKYVYIKDIVHVFSF